MGGLESHPPQKDARCIHTKFAYIIIKVTLWSGQLAAASGVDILVSLCIVPDTWQYGDIVITDSVQCGAAWSLSHISEEADIRPLVAQAGGDAKIDNMSSFMN